MADDDQDPEKPPRPDELDVDRTEEASPTLSDELSAKAIGDILDPSTTALDEEGVDDISGWATNQNEQAAARAQAELDAQSEAEAEAEAETQASIDREGKVRRAMMRLAAGIVLFAGVYGCTQLVGGDDDSAEVDAVGDEAAGLEAAVEDLGVDTADTGVSDDAGDETEESADESSSAAEEGDTTDASSVDVPDDLVRPRAYNAMTDAENQLWMQVLFHAQWGPLPPEFFSGFGDWFLSVNPTAEVGWETHDGVNSVLGTTSEAYILDDGSVVFATGIFPTRPFVLSIDARFGSWPDEAGPPAVFGEESTSIDSESIGEGDPLKEFGGEPVFDLVAGN